MYSKSVSSDIMSPIRSMQLKKANGKGLNALLRLRRRDQLGSVEVAPSTKRRIASLALSGHALVERHGHIRVLGGGTIPPMVGAIAKMYEPVFRELETY